MNEENENCSKLQLDMAHDRNLIEASFEDFDNHNYYTEEEVAAKFKKYGWLV